MSIPNNIEVNRADLEGALDLFEFVGGNAADATRIAINRTGPKVRTVASREIRSQVRLTARYVNDQLHFVPASRGNLVGKISTPSRGLSLAKFSTDTQVASDSIRWIRPPEEPARGIKVKVKPNGPTKEVTGGASVTGKPFYVVARNSGILLIAQRRANGDGLKYHFGPSLSQVFTDVKDDINTAAADEYQAQLLDAMRYLLARRYPPEA